MLSKNCNPQAYKFVFNVNISLRAGVVSWRKCQPIKTVIRLFFTCEKNRTTNQNAHVKNIVCSEIRILSQPNTTRTVVKSLYSHINCLIIIICQLLFLTVPYKIVFQTF